MCIRDRFHHNRRLSDSSTQGVRELLGLTAKPTNTSSKPTDTIARLFSSFEGGTQSHGSSDAGFGNQLDSQSCTQMNEVIGLCSGVFPTMQAHQHLNDSQKSKSSFKLSSRLSNAGTSDGMSNHSSDDEGGDEGETQDNKMAGDKALLRWAKRQRQLQLRVGGSQKHPEGESDSEDEDMPLIKRRRTKLKQKPSKQ